MVKPLFQHFFQLNFGTVPTMWNLLFSFCVFIQYKYVHFNQDMSILSFSIIKYNLFFT